METGDCENESICLFHMLRLHAFLVSSQSRMETIVVPYIHTNIKNIGSKSKCRDADAWMHGQSKTWEEFKLSWNSNWWTLYIIGRTQTEWWHSQEDNYQRCLHWFSSSVSTSSSWSSDVGAIIWWSQDKISITVAKTPVKVFHLWNWTDTAPLLQEHVNHVVKVCM